MYEIVNRPSFGKAAIFRSVLPLEIKVSKYAAINKFTFTASHNFAVGFNDW